MSNLKIKKLELIHSEGWDGIPDIRDYNLDVFVTLNTGDEFVFTLVTPKNFLTIMKNDDDKNFYDGLPMIVVKELRYDVAFETLTKFLEENNGYLFKLYALAGYGINDDGLFDYLLKQHKNMFDD